MNDIPAPVHRLVGQLRDLLDKATSGPWRKSHMEWDESGYVIIAGGRDRIKVNWNGGTWRKQCEADAELIATAINALPALLAIAEAAELACDDGPFVFDDCPMARLRAVLSLLPNVKDHRAGKLCSTSTNDVNPAPVHRLVGQFF